MRHSTCDIVYAGKELKQGSSRKIVAFFFAANSGKRFGGLLRKEYPHTSVHLFVAITFFRTPYYRYRNRHRKETMDREEITDKHKCLLDKMKEDRIFSICFENNAVYLNEQCDDYFSHQLTKEECLELSRLFDELANEMD